MRFFVSNFQNPFPKRFQLVSNANRLNKRSFLDRFQFRFRETSFVSNFQPLSTGNEKREAEFYEQDQNSK
jgi:hypothetical protein